MTYEEYKELLVWLFFEKIKLKGHIATDIMASLEREKRRTLHRTVYIANRLGI